MKTETINSGTYTLVVVQSKLLSVVFEFIKKHIKAFKSLSNA